MDKLSSLRMEFLGCDRNLWLILCFPGEGMEGSGRRVMGTEVAQLTVFLVSHCWTLFSLSVTSRLFRVPSPNLLVGAVLH